MFNFKEDHVHTKQTSMGLFCICLSFHLLAAPKHSKHFRSPSRKIVCKGAFFVTAETGNLVYIYQYMAFLKHQ
jgi:hypothetical protein